MTSRVKLERQTKRVEPKQRQTDSFYLQPTKTFALGEKLGKLKEGGVERSKCDWAWTGWADAIPWTKHAPVDLRSAYY